MPIDTRHQISLSIVSRNLDAWTYAFIRSTGRQDPQVLLAHVCRQPKWMLLVDVQTSEPIPDDIDLTVDYVPQSIESRTHLPEDEQNTSTHSNQCYQQHKNQSMVWTSLFFSA